MKRLLWLVLLLTVVTVPVPNFVQASDTNTIDQAAAQSARKHKHHRRHHHKNHHKGHLAPDRYPQE